MVGPRRISNHGTYVAAMIFLAVLVLVGIAVSILLANSRQTADRDVARPAGVANPA